MIAFEQWGHGWRERFWSWLARRLPRELVYHAVIRCFAHGTTGRWGDTEAPGLTLAEALQRWKRPPCSGCDGSGRTVFGNSVWPCTVCR